MDNVQIASFIKTYYTEPTFKENTEMLSELDGALIYICRTGDSNELQKFMKTFPNQNVNVADGYPLKIAIRDGHLEIAKMLIQKYGADVNVSNGYPIRRALFKKDIPFVKFLITDAKANVNIDNMMPFRIAIFNAFDSIVNLMIVHGASIKGVDIRILDNILYMACIYGLVDIVKFLRDSGFNVYKTKALKCAKEHNHTTIVEFLSTRLCDDESEDEIAICKRCLSKESLPDMIICQSCSDTNNCDGCDMPKSDVKFYTSDGDVYWMCDECVQAERCYACKSTFSMGSLCNMCREDALF